MFRVNLFTGELCLTIADLWLPGLIPVNLQRVYQSQSTWRGAFGLGWSHPYEILLKREGSNFVLSQGPEELHRFKSNSEQAPAAYVLSRVGQLWTVASPAERRTYYFSDDENAMPLRAIGDRNDNRLLFEYDVDGRLVALTDPVSRRLEFRWRGGFMHEVNLTARSRPRENVVILQCSYDREGRLVSTVDRVGARDRYGWADERLVSHMNPLGGLYCAQYDAGGRCIRVWEQDSAYMHGFVYDTVRRTTMSTDSVGHATLHRFDVAGNLTEKVDPLGGSWKDVRDANGALLASLNPAGKPATLSRYDPETRVFTRTDAAGSTTTLEKNEQGDVVAVVDAAGQQWQYRYDERGNVVEMETPAANVWRFTYTERGELATAVDPTGSQSTWRWSMDRSELIVADALGMVATREYDLLSRIVRYVDGRGAAFEVLYIGREQRVVNGDGSEQRWQFDPMGNMVSYTNEAGHVWRFEWDRYARLRSSTDPLGATTHCKCDADGRIAAISNERGERLEQTRDALGRIVRERDFGGGEQTWSYDSVPGPVHTRTANDDEIHIERDPVGRPLKRTYGGNVVFEDAYDGLGRLIRAQGPSGTVELAFDPEGRPLAEVTENAEVRWEYGSGQRPVRLLAPSRDVRFAWDARGRLVAINEGALHTTCSYDDQARRDIVRFDTGIAIVREYDVRNRLVRQYVKTPNGASILDERWAYAKTGNPVARERKGNGQLAFEHNARGELSRVLRNGAEVRRFAYDPSGNITHADGDAWSYGPGNRLFRTSTATLEYDDSGRPTLRSSDGGKTRYAFDALGRLAKVATPKCQVSFDYDPFFRRIAKHTPAGGHRTLWVNNTPLTEELPDGGMLAYVFHPVDEVPVALAINGVWHYAVTGFRGELTDLIRSTDGAVVWSADPLGFESEVTRDGLDIALPLRERGQLADRETGLIYQRARYYDPQLRRFLTPDPLGVFAGWNFYRYCFNRPFLLMDPLGLACTATQQECDDIHTDIQNRTGSVRQRWNESHSPSEILPWSGAPPVGQLYTAPHVRADGTAIAVGEKSKGSVDTHLRNYDEEQRGLGSKIQEYYKKGCAKYEDAARADSMAGASTWSTKPMSLPAYGLP